MADATKKTADSAAKELPAPVPPSSGGPIQFFDEVRRETSKVTWPTWKETWLTTIDGVHHGRLTMVFFFRASICCSPMGERWLIGAMG